MIVAADAGDNPLADRREDRKAAAERERKAKVAKVASQATNAMAAVRAQLDLREKGAADKAANKANDDAGAPERRRLRCSNECSLPASTVRTNTSWLDERSERRLLGLALLPICWRVWRR